MSEASDSTVASNSSSEMFSLADTNDNNYLTASSGASSTAPLRKLPHLTTRKMVTTSKTLRRCCGFLVALFGCLFYCIRAVVVTILLAWRTFFDDSKGRIGDYKPLALEALICTIGIVQFILLMLNPRFTLLEPPNNFKNVFLFLLIPVLSWFRIDRSSSKATFILPSLETLFFTFYIYGLSLDGRSSSLWAGFKPFRFEPLPLVLPVPPSSKAYPQYTVPISSPV